MRQRRETKGGPQEVLQVDQRTVIRGKRGLRKFSLRKKGGGRTCMNREKGLCRFQETRRPQRCMPRRTRSAGVRKEEMSELKRLQIWP